MSFPFITSLKSVPVLISPSDPPSYFTAYPASDARIAIGNNKQSTAASNLFTKVLLLEEFIRHISIKRLRQFSAMVLCRLPHLSSRAGSCTVAHSTVSPTDATPPEAGELFPYEWPQHESVADSRPSSFLMQIL